MKLRTSAVILAGGIGSRMNADKTKQFISICGKTVIERTVFAFDACDEIDEIIVVLREEEIDSFNSIINKTALRKPLKIANAGTCRAESAKKGFSLVGRECDYVAIHDAARCLVTPEMIAKVVKSAHKFGAASAVCSIRDTVKTVDENGMICSTLPREKLFRAQTPQVFSKEIYIKALEECEDLGRITDDNMLLEGIGAKICAVDLGTTNLKITTSEDLVFARNIINGEEVGMSNLRIGHGYDVHRLTEGRKLIIGGVEIPHNKGLFGHSDADVLVHAIMDSLLGAAGLGDIGRHFPDGSNEFLGISSIHLLTRVHDLLHKNGYSIVNIDATLVLQSPKVSPYVDKMRSNIAFALGIPQNCVNIKATTEEHLGFSGREEGASAHAVSMICIE